MIIFFAFHTSILSAVALIGLLNRFIFLLTSCAQVVATNSTINDFVKTNPPIHILINNSGGPKPGPIINANIDDFIDGMLKVAQKGEHLNLYHIGTSDEVSISDLACLVAEAYSREINIVPSQITPGSTPRRCPDISKISALGFSPKVSLEQGVKKLVAWYRNNKPKKNKV